MSRWRVVLASLFALAWAWRWFFLHRVAQTPLFESLGPDSQAYWAWAGNILRNGPVGQNPFFLGPLYPYTLAGLRGVLGDSVAAVLSIQALWGAVAVLLLADAARRLSTPVIGALVGVILAGFEMTILLDGLILSESLLFLLEAALLWFIVRTDWRPFNAVALVVVGVLVGLLSQGRATAVLLLVPLAATICRPAVPEEKAWRRFAIVSVTCLLMALPGALHNWRVAREWIPWTYNLGFNLFVGNNPEATGSFVIITDTMAPRPRAGAEFYDGGAAADGRDYLRSAEGVELSPTQSSRHWARKALAFMREHPGTAVRLAVVKVLMFWNWREYPQIESLDVFRRAIGPIGLPWLGTFAPLCVLAFLGWRAASASLPGRFAIGYVLALTAGIAPFFVTDRYRIHLVPAVALLASMGVAHIVAIWRDSPRRLPVGSVLGLLAGVCLVSLPILAMEKTQVEWDITSDLGSRWLQKGRPDRALQELGTAIRIDTTGGLPPSNSASARLGRSNVYGAYAEALRQLGRSSESIAWYERAYRLAPWPEWGTRLAVAFAMSGQIERARTLCAQNGIPPEQIAAALVVDARKAYAQHQPAYTEQLLQAATGLDRTRAEAWVALVRLHVELRHFDQARSTLLDARAAGLPEPSALAHEAFIAVAQGDTAGARRALERLPPTSDADPTLSEVLRYVYAAIGPARRANR